MCTRRLRRWRSIRCESGEAATVRITPQTYRAFLRRQD
jgi:hypothetical protein